MELRADAVLPFPRDLVFRTYRDRLVELLPYLPNVRGIEQKSRDDEGETVKMLNVWHGGGEIPKAARAFLSDSMLSWNDYATWDEGSWVCSWRIETLAFTEAVSCAGTNTFVDDGAGGTRLEIRGTLTIDAKKIKGVPSLVAGKVGKMIEEVLAQKIEPNLVEVSRGVEKFLTAHK